jgi:hypothetical protein
MTRARAHARVPVSSFLFDPQQTHGSSSLAIMTRTMPVCGLCSRHAGSGQMSASSRSRSPCGRRSSASEPLPVSTSTKMRPSVKLSRFNTCETKTDGLRNGGFLAHRSPQGAKMRQKSNSTPASSETLVRNIRRATRSDRLGTCGRG